MKSVGFVLLVGVIISSSVHAFFKVPCQILSNERLDPLVFPNQVKGHSHGLFGGSNLGLEDMTWQYLQESKCTSCAAIVDKSLYWIPDLYFQYKNGSFIDVPGDNILAYYMQRGQESGIKAFPEGFRMISGNPTLRSEKGDVPHQINKAIDFACLGTDHEDTPYIPPYHCPEGLRGQVFFPNCWDGKNLDTDDHVSHMAYSGEGGRGDCPPTHPVRLMSLLVERTYNTFDYDPSEAMNPDQPFVFAEGDPTGYGYHTDFVNGWAVDLLQKAVDDCDAASGLLEECPHLKTQELNTEEHIYSPVCRKTPDVDEIVQDMVLESLPGRNPVQWGPEDVVFPPEKSAPPTFKRTYVYSGAVPPPWAQLPDNEPQVVLYSHGYEYKGCFSDEKVKRVLETEVKLDGGMSVDKCLQAGIEKDLSLCGVENGGQCFCSDKLKSTSYKLDYQNCDTACEGDQSENCGGYFAMNLYDRNY